MGLLELRTGTVVATVNLDNQQLVGLSLAEDEVLHGGGKPSELKDAGDAGWPNSEIVMFPIIGPVKNNALVIDDDSYPMAQHGIARHLPWSVESYDAQSVTFVQRYDAYTPVENTKISMPLRWPFSYELRKRFVVDGSGLKAEFVVINHSSRPMPYAFGWHPAFRLTHDTILAGERLAVEEVKALSVTRACEIMANEATFGLVRVISTLPFLAFWSPPEGRLLCIEPVSRFQVWGGFERFENDELLAPGEQKEYVVEIKLK